MKNRKRSFLMIAAAGLAFAGFGATGAMAANVPVYEDGGTFDFTLTSSGTGTFSISYGGALLTTINNVAIPTGSINSEIPALGQTFTITSTTSFANITEYTLSQVATSEKILGAGPGTITNATMQYDLTVGTAINPGFLNLTGNILGMPSVNLETTATTPTIYNFSPFLNGGTTARTFTDVGTNFASILLNGGTIEGSGGFSDKSVPEPSSVLLLCTPISLYFARRFLFKRKSVA